VNTQITKTKTKIDAPFKCRVCPRLATFIDAQKEQYPSYYNGPVPEFASPNPKLIVIGLAPGLHGANRTGRPFTGDQSGELLFETMARFGFTQGQFVNHENDGLKLVDSVITNAVRCVPPQNKPVASEINTCRDLFLKPQLEALPELKVLLCLGKISHDSTIRALGLRLATHKFGHGTEYKDDLGRVILSSYHCSRYNLNTGRMTEDMFVDIFRRARELCDG